MADLKGKKAFLKESFLVAEEEFKDDRYEWKESNHRTTHIPRELCFARVMKRGFNYENQAVGRIV